MWQKVTYTTLSWAPRASYLWSSSSSRSPSAGWKLKPRTTWGRSYWRWQNFHGPDAWNIVHPHHCWDFESKKLITIESNIEISDIFCRRSQYILANPFLHQGFHLLCPNKHIVLLLAWLNMSLSLWRKFGSWSRPFYLRKKLTLDWIL